MYDDRPAPRDFTPERPSDDTDEVIDDEVIDDDPPYDPAKQAPVPEGSEGLVDEMLDVEHPEEMGYDLEDEGA